MADLRAAGVSKKDQEAQSAELMLVVTALMKQRILLKEQTEPLQSQPAASPKTGNEAH